MESHELETLIIDASDNGVVTVTMNRPEKKERCELGDVGRIARYLERSRSRSTGAGSNNDRRW